MVTLLKLNSMYGKQTKEEIRRENVIDARIHISACGHLIDILTIQPDYAMMLEIGGVSFGLCNTDAVKKLLKTEIKEAEKCLNGEINCFE